MTGTTLETFAMVVVTAIVLGLVSEGLKRIFKKEPAVQFDRSGKPLVFITQDELAEFCRQKQEACAAKQIVEYIRKTVTDANREHKESLESMKTELKGEITEIRTLVIQALRENKKGG